MNSPLSGIAYGVVGIVAVLFVVVKLAKPSRLDSIPTVGSSSWLGSWWDSLKFLTNGLEIIQEGYEKHKSVPFKVATLTHWVVVVGSREHVEELQRAPGDTLSLSDALGDRFQTKYTIGPELSHNRYHVPIVRSQMTRSIGGSYPKIRDEITTAFDEVLGLKENEWKSVAALSSIQQVVCRTSNRVFVGLPLCRNPDWINLNIQFTIDLFKGAFIVRVFPKLLRPMVTKLFTRISQSKKQARKLLGPIIEERRKYLNEHGNDWTDKPNDFLTWLMEEAEGPELAVKLLTNRILAVNFAAIHTSSNGFTQVLFYLAANPEYMQPLRDEVEEIIEKEGWSKAALGKMRKVDSFLRECQRVEGMGTLGVMRKATKDFIFSDGTLIPKGTTIGVATHSIHHDGMFYQDADVFKPFRFAEMSEEDGDKHQFVSTGNEYLVFGHGKRACPGRFFAANEMKTMLAHIVTTYDVKLEDGATAPHSWRIAAAMVPDPRAKVMFRRRVD